MLGMYIAAEVRTILNTLAFQKLQLQIRSQSLGHFLKFKRFDMKLNALQEFTFNREVRVMERKTHYHPPECASIDASGHSAFYGRQK
jgi:hypothetical protein